MIIPPADFPVTWEQPGDHKLFWTIERQHFPKPLLPLAAELIPICMDGSATASREAGLPTKRHTCVQHGWVYQATEALASDFAPADEAARAQQIGEEMVASLSRRWNDETFPGVQRMLAVWEQFDLSGASDQQVLAHLMWTWAQARQMWHLHFHTTMAMLLSMSKFAGLFNELFSDRPTLGYATLLQGLDNRSVAADRALWDLSRVASKSPELRAVFENSATADVVGALAQSAPGRAFQHELDGYLQEYGQRSETFDMSDASWIEDPTPVISMLKMLTGQDTGDPRNVQTRLAVEREAAIAAARATLAVYPRQVKNRFEFLLQAAQMATQIQEDHNYWIDQRGMYHIRRVILEVGNRFAKAGAFDRPASIFYLHHDEILVNGAAMTMPDLRGLVAARERERERQFTLEAPPALGTQPAGPPPDDPYVRAAGMFFGGPPPEAVLADEVRGLAGSAGVLRGRVRLAQSLAQAAALQRGEVLVTITTAPAWTHLFAIAGAIVTDTGGPLSHCAIVAREYGIPAVVGTATATALLRTGMLVDVDGGQGVVHVHPEA